MAIGNHNDLTHIVRTSDQWKNTYDKYELIPTGVLCVELVSSDVTKIKIGDGHNIFSKLPYIGDLDLSKYYTKLETDTRIKEILTQEKVVRIKGIIGSKSDLPADARCGDIYFVRQLSSSDNKYIEYIYSPDNTWEPLGGIPVDIDLSEYAKTAYVDDKIEQVNERIDDIEQHGTHTHPNKEILDQITEPYTTADKETLASLHNYDDTEIREMISQSSHTHANKDILDATSAAFTKEDKSKLDQLNPYDDSILKEKIQALERLAHEHSNKRILDRTTASFTTEYERKMRWIRLYTGCTGMEEGIAGLVPAAQAGEEDYVLSGSGEWVPQTGGGGTYELPIASASTLGGIKVGNGLEIDANGVLSTTGGGGGGDSIAEGDGITITTDPQTGVKTISVNTGDNLEVDPNTGELNVTGVDYTAGKGIFIGNEYQNVEYIKNSGNYDQIILTDIIPAYSDKLEMDIEFGAATGNTSNDAFIGCYNIHDTNEYMYTAYIYCVSDSASIAYYNHFKWTAQLDNSNMIYNPIGISYDGSTSQRMTLTLQSSSGTWGSQSANFSSAFDSNFIGVQRGIAIFGSIGTSHGSTTDEFDYVDSMELTIYGVKLYDSNDTLLHNLVPVKKLSDNSGGLYDTVTNKFYGNSGNGSFVTGPAVETDDRIINAKIGNGLDFDSNNAIEVVTGNGLSVNQDNELEVNTGEGLSVNQDNELEVTQATANTLGGVKIGDGINITQDGTISIDDPIEYIAGDGIRIINHDNVLPAGYTPIAALRSTGNQYINTGYILKSNTIIEMHCKISQTSRGWTFPLGVRNTLSNAMMFCTKHYGSGSSIEYWLQDSDAIATASERAVFYNEPVTIVIDNNVLTCVNQTTHETVTLTVSGKTMPSDISIPLYVFATNDRGSVDFYGNMDLYSLKISEDDTVVHEFIPCLNNNNVAGLYDIIDETFKISASGNNFSYVEGETDQSIREIELKEATDSTLGGVIVGDGILVDSDGTISVDPTIIPEITEYEAGTAISIEDVEHGGVTFDAWDSGTGWENVCYSNSTGDSITSYQYEAHSPISNSYTLPAGATHIRAIAYNQNDTMLWTSFSWIDSNDYHFASTSPEDDHYDDWFEIPTGAVKVNFGVRHSKLNTTTAMSLNDIKSVDITVQTVSEIEVDVWTGVAGWTNGDYYNGTSDQFTTSWPYTYHYNPSEYIPVPEGALKIRVIGISNENDSHFKGGGANIFDSNHHHIGWLPCCTVTDEWVDIPEGTVYVQPEVKWNNNNTRTISAADIKSVTLAWKLPSLEINQGINVKYGDGLTVNQNNELEVNLGSGLQFDANGAIEVVGGGGGDTIAEGDGITITTDSQTGIKTIGINVGDGLDIDPITNELFVNGQLPEGTIIKKLTYVGNGSGSSNVIKFTKKPVGILSINGSAGTNYISAIPASINSEYLHGVYGGVNINGNSCSCRMSYNDATNELTFTQSSGGNNDSGLIYNANGKTYTMQYLVKGHAGSGTSENNEVSVIKTISYTGTGTSTNNIQLPETPDYILGINGRDGVSGDMVVFSFDPIHTTPAHQYIYTYCYNSGIDSGYFAGGHGEFTFNSSTNTLTLTGGDQGAACNYLDRVYYLRYVVNETISSYEYTEGGGISITPDPQTGENIISVNVGSGLSIDPNTGELNVTGGGGGSGDTVAEGDGISITTDQQTGDKVIAVNAGAGLQVNQTTNELEPKLGDGLELDEYNAITVDPFYPNALILNCVLDDEPSSDLILHFTLDPDE